MIISVGVFRLVGLDGLEPSSSTTLALFAYPGALLRAGWKDRFYLFRLVGLDGLEPSTSRLSGARSNHLSYKPFSSIPSASMQCSDPLSLSGGGDDGIRTHDPLLAGQVLSQLSYTPIYTGSTFFKDRF